MDDVTRICARLLREGAALRAELRELDHPDIRRQVEERLAAVGLVLATSVYSEHIAVRLSPEVTADAAFDSASNAGLRSDACALIVILWARLVLQKRTAADTRTVPGQASLLPHDRVDAAREFKPSVRLATLQREFGDIVGGRTRIKAIVTQLRRLKFLGGRGDLVEAGPFLELGVDGERMTEFIRRKVLADLIDRKQDSVAAPAEEDVSTRVVRAVAELGGSAAMAEIEQQTGERRQRLQRVVRELIDDGRLRREGERAKTRYLLPDN